MPNKLIKTTFLGDQPVEIYERSQMMWLGSFMAPVVVECYYKLPAPNWPKVQIQARRGLSRIFRSRKGIQLDDEQFNASFRVRTQDEEFAIMLLNPELQRFILDKPSVDWSAGEGAIKLWYRGKLRKKRIDRSLDRLSKFQSLITPELFDWE
ncbi:MAG: hypothetical protein JJ974_09445 [Phycisphaerales bacterium]|nr:hypothetical protein [Phycisphaerales bacterium]